MKHFFIILLGLLSLSGCKKNTTPPAPVKRVITSDLLSVPTCSDTTDDFKFENWADIEDSAFIIKGGFSNTNTERFSGNYGISITKGHRISKSISSLKPTIYIGLSSGLVFMCQSLEGSNNYESGRTSSGEMDLKSLVTAFEGMGNGCHRFYYFVYSSSTKEIYTKGHFDLEVID
jgi:hypothetical protein